MTTAKQLTDEFYRYVIGTDPPSVNYQITELTISYFLEAGIPENEIRNVFYEFASQQLICPEAAPLSFWDNSLLEPNTFYSHPLLQILSPTTQVQKIKGQKIIVCVPAWWIEMKIRFTMDNLIEYFQSKIETPETTSLTKSRIQGLYRERIIPLCEKAYVQPIDLMLSSIDTASKNKKSIISSLKLSDTIEEIFDTLNQKIQYATNAGRTKIIWRSHQLQAEPIAGGLNTDDYRYRYKLYQL